MNQFIKFASQVTWIVLCLAVAAAAQNGVVSIDDVSNTHDDNNLNAGNTHVVSINFDYRACVSANIWAGSNGFEVYSPDGADWGYLQGTEGPSITAPMPEGHGDPNIFKKHFNYDGATWTETGNNAQDPAMGGVAGGYWLGNLDAMGIYGGTSGVTNGIAIILEFTTNVADNGLTLCIDTCNEIIAWEWAAGSDSDFPVWDNGLGVEGPRCMEICAIPNLPPEWCGGQTSDAIMATAYTEVSYQLCGITYENCSGPAPADGYYLVPPYDDGNYGSVDPTSGLWTWAGPHLSPGTYSIEFQTIAGMVVPFVLEVVVSLPRNGVVSIANVSNSFGENYLNAGNTHVVSINFDYRDCVSTNLWQGSNGFKIYSPDGADWGYLQGTVGPSITAAMPVGHGSPVIFKKHFNYDGATWTATGPGASSPPVDGTVPAMGGVAGGYILANLDALGLYGGTSGVTNGVAVILEFTSNVNDVGLTVCIDTCAAITAWEWAAGSDSDFPVWDNGLGVSGPRCMEITDQCCFGRVGDANCSGDDEPTIGDIAYIIDRKFIMLYPPAPFCCLGEADINQSGNPSDLREEDVTIGDVSILIDYLFITGPELGLNNCF